MSKSRAKIKTIERPTLLAVLKENGGPMTPEPAFFAPQALNLLKSINFIAN